MPTVHSKPMNFLCKAGGNKYVIRDHIHHNYMEPGNYHFWVEHKQTREVIEPTTKLSKFPISSHPPIYLQFDVEDQQKIYEGLLEGMAKSNGITEDQVISLMKHWIGFDCEIGSERNCFYNTYNYLLNIDKQKRPDYKMRCGALCYKVSPGLFAIRYGD
jgi:hypothetical protein